MTDIVSQDPNTIVARYNGGPQAGHTVVRNGQRHVFKHFGSGTFNRADTYLSRFFLVNPFLWQAERAELKALGYDPRIFLDPNALVTTPYDMLINQEIERARGSGRHGSCGYGINETMRRSESSMGFDAYACAHRTGDLRQTLKAIRRDWVPKRLAQLGITNPSSEFLSLIDSQTIIDKYVMAMAEMLLNVRLMDAASLRSWNNVVFEGAQGLLLDQDNVEFAPYLTPSNCGLVNVNEICKDAGITEVRAIYATRAYATRHGAGPFPTENTSMSFEDQTNLPNKYQGSLRFGEFNLDLLVRTIQRDLAEATAIEVTHELSMICVDQLPDDATYFYEGEMRVIPKGMLPQVAARAIGADRILVSTAPEGPVAVQRAARHRLVESYAI